MTERLPNFLLRWEGGWIWGLGALAFVTVPLWRGGIGLSWDALNHHIYLGWTAQSPRFGRDFWAASSQSWQFPYLYWPVYRLAMSGASGVTAGAVLALLHSAAIPPVWRVARLCCPGEGWADLALRVLAVALAFLGGVSLVMLEITSNDLLAAIPFLWAVALALPEPRGSEALTPRRRAASGLLAGLAVACKFSNGPLVLALVALWALGPPGLATAVRRSLAGCAWAALGFFLAYGYWGWETWVHFGNPIYPLADGVFEPLRQVMGWRP